MKTIYALVLFSYDYYAWEDVDAVSFSKDALVRRHSQKEMGKDHTWGKDFALVDTDEQHRRFSERDESHWVIKEIPFIE